MATYRINIGRQDIPKRQHREFESPNDEAAKKEFEAEVKKETNSWNDLELVRVDVVEQTTFIQNDLSYRPEQQGRC